MFGFEAPFLRRESQVVRSSQQANDEFKTQEAAYKQQMADIARAMASIQSPEQNAYSSAYSHASGGDLASFYQDQAKYDASWATPEKQSWYAQEYARDVAPTLMTGGNTSQDQAYIGQFGDLKAVQGYDPSLVASQYSASADAASQAFNQKKSEFDAFTQNEERQKQAYRQQLGGGFAGGIIDDTYSDPFNNQISGLRSETSGPTGLPTDPGAAAAAMPFQQPWGMPGFGNPGGGASISGYNPAGGTTGGLAGLGGIRQGDQGYGGPFSAKNPWSPA